MRELTRFDIVGDPKPQGSKTAFLAGGKARMRESSGEAHKDWRRAVADAARAAADGDVCAPYNGALYVAVDFRFRMPRSRPSATRAAGVGWKTSAPDLDKLVRALLDGLKAGGLIVDDAVVACVHARKVELLDSWTGATVTVGSLPAVVMPPPAPAGVPT